MTAPLTDRERALLNEVDRLRASNNHKQNIINQQNQDDDDSWTGSSTGDVILGAGLGWLMFT